MKEKLITRIADYEAEINELENLIMNDVHSDKVPLYKKELAVLKARYTRATKELETYLEKETQDAK